MINIKYSIDNIFRRPGKLILLILQIIIATLILLRGLNLCLNTIETVNRTSNLYNDKKVYRLMDVTSIDKCNKIDSDINSSDKKYELYEYLVNNTKFSICAQNYTNILIENFSSKDEFIFNEESPIINNPYTDVEGNFSNIKAFYLDQGYNEEFPLEVDQGRNFNEKDFNAGEFTNVILGSDYSELYKVGDEFTYFDYINLKVSKIKVIGVLKKHTSIYCGASVDSLDNKVICPQINLIRANNNLSINFDFWLSQTLIVTNNENETIKDIRAKSSELNLYDFNINSVQQEIDRQIDDLKKYSLISILISIVIFLFISIGIVTIQLNEIEENTKEYGIHLLSGASKSDIVKRLCISSFFYLFSGMSIGIYIYTLNNSSYNKKMLVISASVLLLLEILISLFPAKKVKNLQITNYIKGERE